MKYKILLKLLRWFQKKHNFYSGEAGSSLDTVIGIVEVHTVEKWRQKIIKRESLRVIKEKNKNI